MKHLVTRITLVGSGAILVVIGSALMFVPQAFLAMSSVSVPRDPGLMSELTAPSGVLLITGAFMMLGAVQMRFAALGLMVGAIIYGSYGGSRLVSLILQGAPSTSLITALVFELLIGALLVTLHGKQTHDV